MRYKTNCTILLSIFQFSSCSVGISNLHSLPAFTQLGRCFTLALIISNVTSILETRSAFVFRLFCAFNYLPCKVVGISEVVKELKNIYYLLFCINLLIRLHFPKKFVIQFYCNVWVLRKLIILLNCLFFCSKHVFVIFLYRYVSFALI